MVVWVVGDQTIKGDETGTSFKQALLFKECGFNLFDTMIYQKAPRGAVGNNKTYWQTFDYMFVFNKDVGNFYKKYEAQELIKKYENSIGIKIIYSKGPYYCTKCSQIVTSNICKHSGSKYEKQISGTYIRSRIINKKQIDKRMFRSELINNMNSENIFINE